MCDLREGMYGSLAPKMSIFSAFLHWARLSKISLYIFKINYSHKIRQERKKVRSQDIDKKQKLQDNFFSFSFFLILFIFSYFSFINPTSTQFVICLTKKSGSRMRSLWVIFYCYFLFRFYWAFLHCPPTKGKS